MASRQTACPAQLAVAYSGFELFTFVISPVGRFELQVLRNLALPAVAVGEQPLLVVIELFASSLSQTRSSGPRRWRRPGIPPGRARSKCTSPCRYRSGRCAACRRYGAAPPQTLLCHPCSIAVSAVPLQRLPTRQRKSKLTSFGWHSRDQEYCCPLGENADAPHMFRVFI